MDSMKFLIPATFLKNVGAELSIKCDAGTRMTDKMNALEVVDFKKLLKIKFESRKLSLHDGVNEICVRF